MSGPATDRWSRWLLGHRHGNDPDAHKQIMETLLRYRDSVLDGARLRPGDTLLDVGCGDGLIAIGALDRLDASGEVIFADVSEPLLSRCRETVEESGSVVPRRFVHTGLPELAGITTGSVDVVTTRSVLIYVADLAAAFAAFHRVLRRGGRLSIFEPINRFSPPPPAHQLWGYDITGMEALADKVKAVYRDHLGEDNPMLGFDERDLLREAEAAGFTDIRLTFQAEVTDVRPGNDWATMIQTAPNPLVPTLTTILEQALTPDERSLLADHAQRRATRPTRQRTAVAYLTATVDPTFAPPDPGRWSGA